MGSYYINIHVSLILSLPSHFISVFFSAEIFFPSCISKSEGWSPSGMGGRLAVGVTVCWPENQNRIPRMFAGWDPFFYSSSVDAKEKHRTQTSIGHWVKAWAPTLVQVSMTTETPWKVVYNPHRNLGGIVCLHHSLKFCNPIYFMGERPTSQRTVISVVPLSDILI